MVQHKAIEILAKLVDTYEIGNGCGTFTATKTVGFYEVEPFTRGLVRVGKVIEGKRYVYMWEGIDGENPVGDIEPDVIVLQDDKDLIYLFEL